MRLIHVESANSEDRNVRLLKILRLEMGDNDSNTGKKGRHAQMKRLPSSCQMSAKASIQSVFAAGYMCQELDDRPARLLLCLQIAL